MTDTLDYATTTDSNIAFSSDTVFAGQTFQTPPASISGVKFYLKQLGTATGNCYAVLYAHQGTYGVTGTPTGTSLATSDTVNAGTVVATDYDEVEFTFSTAYPSNFGIYGVGLHYHSASDGDNTLYMARGLATDHPGVSFIYTTAGGYVTDSANDAGFAVLGTLANFNDPQQGGSASTTVSARPRSVAEITRSASPMIKASAQAMKNAMMERARIAKMDAIRNQRAIKKLKK